MKTKTINATLVLPVEQLAELLCAGVPDRHAAMVEKHGEACTKSQAARLIRCSPTTITSMLQDGRLKSACGGTRVDVRSLADYIEDRGEMDHAARLRRKKARAGGKLLKSKAPGD